jgi:hypothetical protein
VAVIFECILFLFSIVILIKRKKKFVKSETKKNPFITSPRQEVNMLKLNFSCGIAGKAESETFKEKSSKFKFISSQKILFLSVKNFFTSFPRDEIKF